VVINEHEIEKDKKWDGLKGYVTNTDLDAQQAVAQYQSFWYEERAFRVTKGNLEARPIFHFTEKRIEAHICICFIAYKVYKELQRIIDCIIFAPTIKSNAEQYGNPSENAFYRQESRFVTHRRSQVSEATPNQHRARCLPITFYDSLNWRIINAQNIFFRNLCTVFKLLLYICNAVARLPM